MYACLGGGVIGLAELALLAIDRAYIDDAAPLLVDHVFNDLLGDIEQAVKVGINNRAPVFLAHFAEQAIAGNACIVDQNIDWPQFIVNLSKDRKSTRLNSSH